MRRTEDRWWLAILWCVVALGGLGARAVGQDSSVSNARSALSASSDAGHLWLVIKSGTNANAGVWHVPVRAGGAGSRVGGVRWAYLLEAMPVGVAARSERVAMFFARDDGGFTVRGLSVERTQGGWQNASVGRLDAMVELADEGELVGAAWNELGLIVLIRGGDGYALRRLARSGWESLALPELGESGVAAVVELGGDAIGLVGESAGERWMWRGQLAGGDQAGGDRADWRWSQEELPGGDALKGELFVDAEGELIALEAVAGQAGVVRRQGRGSVWKVGEVPAWAADPGVGVGVLRADERLVLLQAERSGALGDERPRILEMSILSGRVFIDDEAVVLAPVIGRDLRLLFATILLLVFMVVAMVGVRMPEAPVVPEGWMLAPVLARVLGATGDLLVAGLVVSLVRGGSLAQALWLESGMGLEGAISLGLVLFLAFTHTTVGEWLFGISLGKLLVGCKVIGACGESRVGLGRIAARNAMKWLLPPSVLLGWVDPYGRHTGDALARTVVVMGPLQES